MVVEAAGRGAPVAFVVNNSGPGVTPAQQERFAARNRMEVDGLDDAEEIALLEQYDVLLEMMSHHVPFDEVGAKATGAFCGLWASQYGV